MTTFFFFCHSHKNTVPQRVGILYTHNVLLLLHYYYAATEEINIFLPWPVKNLQPSHINDVTAKKQKNRCACVGNIVCLYRIRVPQVYMIYGRVRAHTHTIRPPATILLIGFRSLLFSAEQQSKTLRVSYEYE